MAETAIAIEARHVSKRFLLRHNRAGSIKERALAVFHRNRQEQVEPFWALRDLNVTIERGESVALVGRNGSGKSTFLKIIAGIYTPTSGHLFVTSGARIGTMIELGVGFHGELTATENVYLNAAIYGLSRPDIDALYPRIVAYSGLEKFMDVAIKNFSSGMHMRLGFAIAANLDPDILLLDEIFAVGDAEFQRKCIDTMREFRARGRTIVFVSHAPAAVRAVCERACVLDCGSLAFDGTVEDGLKEYGALMRQHGETLPGAGDRAAPASDGAWHRTAMGGQWDAIGDWGLEFLEREGLKPRQFVLDVGCGSLPLGARLLPFMERAHYWGVDIDRDLYDAGVTIELAALGVLAERGHFIVHDEFDLSECPYRFDVAIAHSFLHRLAPSQVGPCLAAVVKYLKPGGRFYVAVGAPETEGGRPPLAAVVEQTAATLGVACEPVPGANHPRGDEVLVLVKS